MISKVFPTIENLPPYKAKASTPYAGVYITDTPYTVKSHGPDVFWYAFQNNIPTNGPDFSTATLYWKSNNPNVKIYSGANWPPEVAHVYNSNTQYASKYIGRFVPESTTATFYFRGTGYVRAVLDNYFDTGTLQLGTDQYSDKSQHVTGLSGNPTLTLYYWNKPKTENSVNTFVVTWKDSTLPKPIVLSAGNYLPEADKLGVPSTLIRYVSNIQTEFTNGNTSKLTFEVPIATLSSITGYVYNQENDYFVDVNNSNKIIKKFRMVELSTGYDNSGVLATTTGFVGQVRGWYIQRNSKGSSVAKIECYDWTSFLNDSFNETNPDISDYLASGYIYEQGNTTNNPYNVDGVDKPRTYDGWAMSDAVDNILINANIDPKTFLAKKRYVTTDDVVITGNYYTFNERNTNYPIVLERGKAYGNPLGYDPELGSVDSHYIWQFSIGEKYNDNLKKLFDTYGITYGFNSHGEFFTHQQNAPVQFFTTDFLNFDSNWADSININAIKLTTSQTTTSGAVASISVEGKSFILVTPVGPSFGTLSVVVSNATLGNVISGSINLSHSTNWNYRNGLDPNLGYNPCLTQLGSSLNYGSYLIELTSTSSSEVGVNAILNYDENFHSPVDVLYSGDLSSSTPGVFTNSYSVESSANNIRNDVIVVGRLLGVQSSLGLNTDAQQLPINPNNPISEHVISRSLNISSIGSISNKNYTGRKLSMIAIDDKIVDQNRADWIATETLRRFNDFKKSYEPRIEIIGNPLYQINDMVRLKDIATNIVGTIQDYWIEGISNSYTAKNGFKTRLSLSSFKPWDSYTKFPQPNLADYGYNPFQNFTVTNNGAPELGQVSSMQSGSSTIWVEYADLQGYSTAKADSLVSTYTSRVPKAGYIKVGNEVIRYDSRTVIASLVGVSDKLLVKYSDLHQGYFNTATTSITAGEYVEGGVSVYSTEDFGLPVRFNFNLITPGFVQIKLISETGQDVASLTNSESAAGYNEPWIHLDQGSHEFTWSFLDRFGKHNETNVGEFTYSGDSSLDTPNAPVSQLGNWNYSYGTPPFLVKPTSDRYVANTSRFKRGKFFVQLQYEDRTNQYAQGVMDIPVAETITTHLRPTGRSATTGIREEVSISSSSVDYSSVATVWSNQSGIKILSPSGWNRAIGKEWRAHFTDEFNFSIVNGNQNNRIVSVSIDRVVFIFGCNKSGYVTLDGDELGNYIKTTNYSQTKLYEVLSSEIYNSTELYSLQPNTPFVFTIKKPNNIPFLPSSIRTAIDEAIKKDKAPPLYYDEYNPNEFSDTILNSFVVSHLHSYRVTVTDQSGRTQSKFFGAFHIPQSFYNSQADILAGTNLKNGFPIPEDPTFFNYSAILGGRTGVSTYGSRAGEIGEDNVGTNVFDSKTISIFPGPINGKIYFDTLYGTTVVRGQKFIPTI